MQGSAKQNFGRAHARHICDVEVEVHIGAPSGRLLGRGRILNVSLSGAFLLFEPELKRGTAYRLRIADPRSPLEVPFRVAREGPRGSARQPQPRSYGLAFDLAEGAQSDLHRFIDRLPRELSPEEERLDRSLRDYWSIAS